ncbi:YadA-like family protein [Megamonas sp.]|uniref:YadA-like family protein n=2 Tax=Megamonas sp. TaxID=2049033 RepID=UPI002585CCDA|nr:YadA-like family protein [Megamonas sp.]
MASNKKAQILAAVMCASSIFGSYTVVSAADTPTKIESTDKNSSVTANGSTITATAGAQGSQQSTITLGNKSLAINVGKQTTTDGTTYGTFTLNSSNLAVNNSGLSVKNTKGIVVGSISNTGAITGTGLTIKNGTGTTLASLNNNGLNIYDGINTKATATITKAGAITGTGLTVKAVSDPIKPEGNYVESKVTTSGVADTIKQGGFTRATSNVTTNSIKDTIYTDSGTELSSINVFKNTAANGIENGKVSLTAKKIVTDNQTSTTTTSTLTLGGDNASLKVGNYGFTVDSNNNVLFSGKNASLTSTGLTVNGTGTSSIKSTNATTGAMGQSQVSYNGVTDAVYGTDGARVAYSNVGTGGISNTTSLKTTTGKIDTAINQNTSGVGISSTKYDTNNNVTDKTSVSVNGGTSSITSYGNYIYGEDGKATSYNQASISLNGNTGTATIRGGSNTASSTLTLNEAGVALSGKNVGLNANGLTLYKDVDGVKTQYASLSTGGLSVNGTGSTTIKSTNATTGAIGQSQVSYNGVTDSFTKDDVTNSVTTNANGTTFSSTGNGSTTIKGDTIKTTNLIVNGKDIGGVATDVAGIDRNTENEDGLGYYTQIEGKTKIYNTGRFSTANGNFVVDPYGSITSKAGNYRFNMDRTNGFDLGYAATTSFTLDNTGVSLGFRNNSFILDKNGATFINANGENVSFTSINGGTITTGETVINGSSITTKDLYVDNIHLNGAITDGNGNVVGGGDLSLGADGTLDLKYNANGITNTFVSGATGVHSSFSNGTTTASSSVGYIDDKNTIGIKDQVGNTSVTTTTDGTTFANGSGSTTINGGNITTTGDVTVGGDLSVGDNFKVDGTTGNVTGGTYNGVQISTDKDGNAIIGGTNIGDLATNEEVNKVNDKVDAVDNKVGDTSKLDKEITDNQNYKDNPNLVGAVNAEADIRRNEISRIDGQIEQLDGRVGSLENRMSDVEDRIDKVGAMSAAIANLRTMGFDPEAPTEIAIGVGQYKSETGLALGVFHYPNQDFMLSASISTSGDEVMGGIGATWKLGRKSAAEKAKDEEARRLEKAEEMKKLAQDAKVKAQAERHAKLLAEREAQKTA